MAQRLPRAIREQVEAADRVLASATAPDAPAVDPLIPSAPTPPANEEVQPPAPEPEAPAAPVAQPPAPPAQPAPENWEHKFRTLQGVFNSQMPKLQEANRQLEAKVNELAEELKKRGNPATPPAPAPEPEDTAKDKDEFGRDMVEMVQRQVRAYTAKATSQFDAFKTEILARLDKLEKGVKATGEKVELTAEENYFARLALAVPDWKAINADQAFLAWLGEADPVYRVPRQVALDKAFDSHDVDGTAAVFNAFKALKPVAASPAPMKKVLDGQVSPSGAPATPAPTPPKKEVFSAAQVESFYKEVAQGKWRGREKEAAAVEERINLALAEGRIV